LVIYYQVFLKDTDERACAYIAGPAPNRWGFTFEGNDLFESVGSPSPNDRECFHHILGFNVATSVKFFNLLPKKIVTSKCNLIMSPWLQKDFFNLVCSMSRVEKNDVS